MTTIDEPRPRPRTRDQVGTPPQRLSFVPSLRPLLVFLLVIAISYPALVYLAREVLPPSPIAGNLFTAIAITGSALVAWGVLHWEGVSLKDVGLDGTRAITGLLAVSVVWLLVNVIGYGWLVLQGAQPAPGLPADPAMGIPVGAPLPQLAVAAITLWVFVGIGEEFAFRGYLQNKLIAHVGTSRSRKALGIVGAAVLFALVHVPVYVGIAQVPVPQLAVALAFVTVYALILGVLYEYTRNVVLVGLFHGTFDLNPIFVVGETGEPIGDLTLLVLPVALVVFWGYRRWANAERPTDFQPQETVPAAD